MTALHSWWRWGVHYGRYAAIAVPVAWMISCLGVPDQIWKGLDDPRLGRYVTIMAEQKGEEKFTLQLGPWRLSLLEQPELVLVTLLLTEPFDMIVCPTFDWGCGYLEIRGHKKLLAGPAQPEVLERVRAAKGVARPEDLARIEGLTLQGRSLRGAELPLNNLYAANFLGADLTDAELGFTALPGATLVFTKLCGADLHGAKLPGADLTIANLSGADLRAAILTNAMLWRAHLIGVEAGRRPLDRSDETPPGVTLVAADLSHTSIVGADLSDGDLIGANLSRARLQGADLRGTDLAGADLRGAELQGADLRGADLTGADLRGAKLWQARVDGETDLSLVDLRDADFNSVGDSVEELLELFRQQLDECAGVLDYDRISAARRRVSEALTPRREPFALTAVKKGDLPALVHKSAWAVLERWQR